MGRITWEKKTIDDIIRGTDQMWLTDRGLSINIYGDGSEEVLIAILEKLEEIDFEDIIRSKIENIPGLENLRIEVL